MDASEAGKRIRAARAYAGFSAPVLAQAVGVGRSTLLKMEAGEREPNRWELIAIAELCDVPREFLTLEWNEMLGSTDPDPAAPLEELAGRSGGSRPKRRRSA